MLRKRCLILDHDDTVVNSTAVIHHPAYLEAMRVLRPGVTMTLQEYFAMNCDPGIFRYYREVVCLTEEETRTEYGIWKQYVRERVPQVFEGMDAVIRRQKALGGAVCVITHSDSDHVYRDYAAAGLPEPDLVFGGERPEAQRKPEPWPVLEALRLLGMQPEEAVVVDDLVPGLKMAEAAGTACIAARWAHRTPAVAAWVQQRGIPCADTPKILAEMLFD